MTDTSNELRDKIFTGKQALSNNYIDVAIQAFQEALNAKIPGATSQNSLIGIAQAYLLLALGIKGEQDDDSTSLQMTDALALLPDKVNHTEAYTFFLMDIGKLLPYTTSRDAVTGYTKVSHYLQLAMEKVAINGFSAADAMEWYNNKLIGEFGQDQVEIIELSNCGCY